MTNDRILNQARDFFATFAHASDETLDVLVLASAVTHATDAFTSLPRVLITSSQMESGKSVMLDGCAMLSANAINAAGSTQEGLKAYFYETPGATLVRDEISQVFGEAGTQRREHVTYDVLNRGYMRGETITHSVQKVPVDVSIFGVAFIAGLRKAVPDDLASRSIRITAKRKPDTIDLDDRKDPGVAAVGAALSRALHHWVRANAEDIRVYAKDTNFRRIHPKLTDRRKQIWYSLFSVADAAGGTWPERARRAFMAMALGETDRPAVGPTDQLVLDVARAFRTTSTDRLLLSDIVHDLETMEDRPQYAMSSRDKIAKDISRAFGDTARSMRATVLHGKDAGKAGRGMGWYASDVMPTADKLEGELFTVDETAEEFIDPFDVSFE